MPGVGLEYRYPLISTSAFGQQIIEPIAQLIVRPNEVIPKLQPNEDAQSLVFDETNLFAWDKYSGYDRIEGGTRLNYGAQYTANFANGGYANIVGGEFDPARRTELLYDRRRRQHRARVRASTSATPTT